MVRKLTVKVVKIKHLTEEVIILTFNVPRDFNFESGQYLMFKMNDGKETKPRAYSILSPENEAGKIRFIIRLIPGGFASEIFRKTKINDTFDVEGPMGHFFFSKDCNTEHWFISGGCGIAPLYSIIKKYLPVFTNKKFFLLFSIKTRKDLFFHEELTKLQKKCPNFNYLPTLTQECWEGRIGRVQIHLPKDLSNKTFYICGNKDLVLDVRKLLVDNNVDPNNIKFERYS